MADDGIFPRIRQSVRNSVAELGRSTAAAHDSMQYASDTVGAPSMGSPIQPAAGVSPLVQPQPQAATAMPVTRTEDVVAKMTPEQRAAYSANLSTPAIPYRRGGAPVSANAGQAREQGVRNANAIARQDAIDNQGPTNGQRINAAIAPLFGVDPKSLNIPLSPEPGSVPNPYSKESNPSLTYDGVQGAWIPKPGQQPPAAAQPAAAQPAAETAIPERDFAGEVALKSVTTPAPEPRRMIRDFNSAHKMRNDIATSNIERRKMTMEIEAMNYLKDILPAKDFALLAAGQKYGAGQQKERKISDRIHTTDILTGEMDNNGEPIKRTVSMTFDDSDNVAVLPTAHMVQSAGGNGAMQQTEDDIKKATDIYQKVLKSDPERAAAMSKELAALGFNLSP